MTTQREYRKEFIDVVKGLVQDRHKKIGEIWEFAIVGMATQINILCEYESEYTDNRLKRYMKCQNSIGEAIDILMDITKAALRENPYQDFLGSIYQELRIPIYYRERYLIPYSLSNKYIGEEFEESLLVIKEKGFQIYEDHDAGAGCLLISIFNNLEDYGYAPQNRGFFIAHNDIEILTLMSYIQLSVLGAAGICIYHKDIIVGNEPFYPNKQEGYEVWRTPGFYKQAWKRRIEEQQLKLVKTY